MNSNNIEIAIERITLAKKNHLGFLDLSGLNLTQFPIDISEMNYLFELDLSYNNFSSFPKGISELDCLCYLDVSNNFLSEINFKLGKYYALKEINISNNNFNYIPEELFFLNVKTKIIFDNNPFLNGLPPELLYQEDIHYINYYVEALRKVDNRERLFETKLLFVGKGDVGKTTLMNTLKNSKYKFKIGTEKPTSGINIEELMYPIYFPARKPYYSTNYFDFLYFKNFDEEFQINNEGEITGDVKIVESFHPISEYMNLGISEDQIIELRVSSEPDTIFPDMFFKKKVKINMWDFGGQEILYGTHQFFLTQRSLYLFVWDSRTDNEEESFEYWLNTIQRLSDNSPVIIVMNKLDNGIKNIDESSYLDKFNNIVGFHKISCFSKEGIHELLNEISDTVKNLPQIGVELPKSWEDLRKRLKKVNEDFITYSEFSNICNIKSNENVDFLSSYLNDIGDIIHFNKDFTLKDIVVINPHWLTKAIYELIHSLEVQKNNGLFNANDLSKFLDEKIYQSENYHKILLLMEKFEICFKVIGSNNLYVIPTLLMAAPPKSVVKADFKIPESLKYKIEYDFIPSGLIERLICRLKDFLRNKDFWKYGAVFNTELGEALVLLNKPKKSIELFVVGSVKSELYSLIIQEIRKINNDLKLEKNNYTEKLACNCFYCREDDSPYMIDLKVLLNFVEKGRKKIDCQKSAELANIEELLIGYKSSNSQKSLLRSFINASSKFQSHKKLIEKYDENEMNTFFQLLLGPYLGEDNFSNEQSLKGVSEAELKQGELDISIETKDGISISFFEGLILKSINKNQLNGHIIKSLNQYDPNGLKEKFIGVYVKTKDFSSFCKRYFQHISDKHPTMKNINVKDVEDISGVYTNGSEIKIFRVNYLRSDIKLSVYHLLINLN